MSSCGCRTSVADRVRSTQQPRQLCGQVGSQAKSPLGWRPTPRIGWSHGMDNVMGRLTELMASYPKCSAALAIGAASYTAVCCSRPAELAAPSDAAPLEISPEKYPAGWLAKYAGRSLEEIKDMADISAGRFNVPGSSAYAVAMLPLRVAVSSGFFTLLFPPLLVGTSLRSIYMRLAYGRPSQILKHGTFNNSNDEDMHYPCQFLCNQPLDEAKLKAALVGLCAEAQVPLLCFRIVFTSRNAKRRRSFVKTGSGHTYTHIHRRKTQLVLVRGGLRPVGSRRRTSLWTLSPRSRTTGRYQKRPTNGARLARTTLIILFRHSASPGTARRAARTFITGWRTTR